MKRGQIRWFRFARPDEQRPVLILTRSSILDVLGETTVAPITTRVRNIPTEVFVTNEDGMPRDCAVNLDHLQTAARRRIGPLITTLDDRFWPEVRQALLFALGFDEV